MHACMYSHDRQVTHQIDLLQLQVMTALMEWVEGQMAQAESAPEALALLCTVTKHTQE